MTRFELALVISAVPVLLGGAVAAIVAHRVAGRNGDRAAARSAVWRALFATGAVGLLAWTLLLTNPNGAAHRVNLTPFREIGRALDAGASSYGVLNFWGNIAVFMPIGALATLAYGARRRVAVVVGIAAGAALSLGIEAGQYAVGRSADVDDVILNTVGAAAGALIVWAIVTTRRGPANVGARPG